MMWNRRELLAMPAAALVAAAQHPVRLGGPIFLKSDDPRELAREHRRLGYSAAYFPKTAKTDSGSVHAIRAAFAKENVLIAEVGAWVNMLEPDTAKRKKNLDYVTERLALADAVEAKCCVNIAGSYNAAQWDGPHPDNLSRRFLDETVSNCRRVIDAVNPKRTKFTIEMMGWSLPDGPDAYLELIKAVDRRAFGVHMDVCNIINSPQRYYRNAELIDECFRKLGRWTASCHAKDVGAKAVHFAEVMPGRGGLDYRAYLRNVAQWKDVPLMLEHLKTSEEYDEARGFVRKVGSEIGVAFV
ncbi:MAG: TIM barrel protein [Bryobacteraceae bacterium]